MAKDMGGQAAWSTDEDQELTRRLPGSPPKPAPTAESQAVAAELAERVERYAGR